MKLLKLNINENPYNDFQKIKQHKSELKIIENENNVQLYFLFYDIKYYKTYENEGTYIKQYLQNQNVKITLEVKQIEYNKIKILNKNTIYFVFEEIKILINKIRGYEDSKHYYIELNSNDKA